MIVLGADMHKSSYTIAAVAAATGEMLGDKTSSVGARGFDLVLQWARALGVERVWALEDCRHVSGSFERFLIARRERVVRVEAVRPSVCEAEATVVMSVGDPVSKVDLERGESACPGAHGSPFGLGVFDREVDELGGGLLIGEVSAGLDRLADLAVHRLDRVGIQYEAV
jgi:hypothetical protein